MADIELVVKISEENYNIIKNYTAPMSWAEHVIKNGTPLPKGHGKLIDINEITAFRELECNGHDIDSLNEFTTIIEADKEVDNG
jgi:hypothetical protein